MSHLHESNNFRDIIRWEEDEAGRLSRETVTVASGQNLTQGAVVGKITLSTPTTGTAAAGNTGGGTVGSVTAGLKAILGEYQIKCTAFTDSPAAGTFEVTNPEGLRLPDATLAAYTSDQINFDIADGSPQIDAGDIWTVTIAAGSEYVKEIDFDAVDGTQNAYGIVCDDYDATGGAIQGVAIVRNAVIVSANVVWPTTSPAVSAAQKASALAQLAAKAIVARAEA
jgi:hypothetical protein